MIIKFFENNARSSCPSDAAQEPGNTAQKLIIVETTNNHNFHRLFDSIYSDDTL